jgi:hypothetical protein
MFSWPIFLVFIGIAAALPLILAPAAVVGDGWKLKVDLPDFHFTGDFTIMELKDNQQIPITITELDDQQKAILEGGQIPTWTITDPSVATVEVAVDGLSANVIAGNPGLTNLNITVAGVSRDYAVHVLPGDVADILVDIGTPVDKPAPQPAANTAAAPDPAPAADTAASTDTSQAADPAAVSDTAAAADVGQAAAS